MAKNKKKNNVFSKISSFFSSVIVEAKKVIWTNKKNLIKYSVATLSFMLFICVYFVGIDLLIALITYIKELI